MPESVFESMIVTADELLGQLADNPLSVGERAAYNKLGEAVEQARTVGIVGLRTLQLERRNALADVKSARIEVEAAKARAATAAVPALE
jgi:hypothetical protein